MPFNVGPVELIIVLVIALLVVGPRRLPEMGNAVGKTIREFRNASTEVTSAVSMESPPAPESAPQPNTLSGEATPNTTTQPAPPSVTTQPTPPSVTDTKPDDA
jgi:sec-independent protein translocase protein TatA